MTDFSKLDRADDWLAAVARSVGRAAMNAGLRNWNRDPGYDQARERSARLLVLAAKKRDTEAERLVGSRTGVAATWARTVVRTRLQDRAEDRIAGKIARHRDPRPPARASR